VPLRLLRCCCGAPGYPGNMESSYVRDSRLCGNDTSQPASPARAAASCFIRLKCYLEGFCHWLQVPDLQAIGEFRDSLLKSFPPALQEHRSKHKTVWIPAYAGMTHCAR